MLCLHAGLRTGQRPHHGLFSESFSKKTQSLKTQIERKNNSMSSGLTLVIGDKNLSTWSLRPWLVLQASGLKFREVRIRLDLPGTRNQITRHSPSGKVPALHHGHHRIWDSLAICEYIA